MYACTYIRALILTIIYSINSYVITLPMKNTIQQEQTLTSQFTLKTAVLQIRLGMDIRGFIISSVCKMIRFAMTLWLNMMHRDLNATFQSS